jgi:hypothetical protein
MMDHTSLVRNVEKQKTYAMNPKELSEQNNGHRSLRTEKHRSTFNGCDFPFLSTSEE